MKPLQLHGFVCFANFVVKIEVVPRPFDTFRNWIQ